MPMQANASHNEINCGDARSDDLVAISSILNTPGALTTLWAIIQERRDADAQWADLLVKEATVDARM